MSDIIVGLDIGTSNIRIVIGELDENKTLQIIGVGKAPSTGLRSGVIVNVESTIKAISTAIEEAEMMSGCEVKSFVTGIGGTQTESFDSLGLVAILSKNKTGREINQNDIDRAIESAKSVNITMDKEILHIVPKMYIVDKVQRIKDPLNTIGVRLEVEVHIITASISPLKNIFLSANKMGYSVDNVMLKTLAASYSILNEEEKELGSIVIDLGGGSTDVIVIADGAPLCTDSIPIGGNIVTNDISIVKGISLDTAERIKLSDGCCWELLLSEFEEVVINGIGGRPPEKISRLEICQIIQPRIEEMLMMIKQKITSKIQKRQLSGNIVLIGGGAKMPGILELTSSVFGTDAVKIGLPTNLGDISDTYRAPDFATATGLVIANSQNLIENGRKGNEKTSVSDSRSFFGKVKGFFKEFF